MNLHPWGQIAKVEDGSDKYYITGTALHGALHFAIMTDSTGSKLVGAPNGVAADADKGTKSIGFYHYIAGGVSPGGFANDISNGKPTESWPFGGAAPVRPVAQDAELKVAYVVDNKLFVRKLDGSDTTVTGADLTSVVGGLVTSNLIYWKTGQIYAGTANGRVFDLSETGTKNAAVSPDALDLSFPNNASQKRVFGLQGRTIAGTSSDSKILLAQSPIQVSALMFDNTTWTLPWWTRAGSAATSSSPAAGADQVPPMPNASDVTITALPAITAPGQDATDGAVMIPYTKGEVYSATCLAAANSSVLGAWTFGPLDLKTGKSLAANATMYGFTAGSVRTALDTTTAGLNVRTGDGEATGIEVVQYKLGSGCTGEGMTYTAAQAMGSGFSKSYYDGGTSVTDGKITVGGVKKDASKASTNETHFQGTTQRTRLNWRELTNFF